MASIEKNDMEEAELEELEIDAALLRDLLEDDEKDNGSHDIAVESESVGRNLQQQQQQICVEQNECSVHDFEWLNLMELEPAASLNDVLVNWYPEDIVGIGMIDFGSVIEECYSQVCEGLAFDEASYGCLWEDM